MTRASDTLELTLGQVVRDVDDVQWVFLGWTVTTAGPSAYFIRSMTGQQPFATNVWRYNASETETLLKKFPSLSAFI
jgi:hypothetical protein